ncbi:MAG TPA: tetratricopeptide repeat protein [Acidimicrobiales bacterium]|nr:tetratricopeptide repeat protein [Acidimicrobiales bacterium]
MDVTEATFEQEVIERSAQLPVIVDLWAEWCQPCKTLGPVLEKVVGETGGKVALVKVDIEANPRLAQMFQVQSIPAVFALRHRQVVDQFIGALPERDVRAFISRLSPPETEADKLAAAGDEASLRQALALEPAHEAAIVGLSEMLVARGDNDDALALLARIPETVETRRIAALARVGDAPPPDDIDRRLGELLDRVKGDDEARQQFVDLLEVLGAEDPRTAQYRKALATRLY